MKFGIFNSNGECLRIGDAPDDMVQLQCRAGELLYVGECGLNDRLDPATSQLLPGAKPVRPSWEHDWDEVTGTWTGHLDRARQAKAQAIERERDRRLGQAIVFEGSHFDADIRAQKNISDKLATLAQREALNLPLPVDLLVWRDADNQMHAWSDQAAYKSFLGRLAIAIEERGTRAYAWSWGKKAELVACTSFDQVNSLVLD